MSKQKEPESVFTGIVEEVGTASAIDRRDGYQRTTLDASSVLDGLGVGDSISLSGACHTAVEVTDRGFTVESVEETLRRTTMGELGVGGRVNLERSLRLSDRLDGHLVQGHVDGVGTVRARVEDGDNTTFTVEMPEGLTRYVAEKGSICVDGISLTVVSVEGTSFSVTIIPHTLAVTTLDERMEGDTVNLEVDVIARYLERLIGSGSEAVGGLTIEKLQTMGYNL